MLNLSNNLSHAWPIKSVGELIYICVGKYGMPWHSTTMEGSIDVRCVREPLDGTTLMSKEFKLCLIKEHELIRLGRIACFIDATAPCCSVSLSLGDLPRGDLPFEGEGLPDQGPIWNTNKWFDHCLRRSSILLILPKHGNIWKPSSANAKTLCLDVQQSSFAPLHGRMSGLWLLPDLQLLGILGTGNQAFMIFEQGSRNSLMEKTSRGS